MKKGLLLLLILAFSIQPLHSQVEKSSNDAYGPVSNNDLSRNQSNPGIELPNGSVSSAAVAETKLLVDGVSGYKRGDLWGLKGANGKEITSPKYVTVDKLNRYIKASMKGKVTNKNFYGVISAEDEILIPFNYAMLEDGGDRVIAVHKNGRELNFGLLSFSNQIIIPFEYYRIKQLSHTRFSVEDYDHKIALFDDRGAALTGFDIDSIGYFEKDHALFYSDALVGLLNNQGRIVLDGTYKAIDIADEIRYQPFPEWISYNGEKSSVDVLADDLIPINREITMLSRNGNYQLLKNTGYRSDLFDYIDIHQPNAWHVKKNDKHGVVDSTGYVIVPITYDSLFLQDEFVYAYYDGEGSKAGWSILDIYGSKRSKRIYQDIKPYRHGMFPVKRNNKWGFMDRQGDEAIYCVYVQVDIFSRDLIIVNFHGEDGVIDRKGNWIVTPRKGKIELINRDYFLLSTPRETRFYSIDDDLIYFTELPIRNVDGYLLEEVDSGVYWQIDYSGVRIQESTLDNIYPIYKDSVYVLNHKGRVGLRVRGQKDIFFSEDYEELFPPSEDFMKVKVAGSYGFVDFDGKLRIAYRYEDARDFKEGRAAIKIRGKWGFIDKYENLVIQPLYDEVSDFEGEVAKVKKGNKYGLVDLNGEMIEDIRFDEITKLETGRHYVIENGLAGLLDEKGEIIISPKYEDIIETDMDELIVKRDGLFGIINSSGRNILPSQYNIITYDPYNKRYLLAVARKSQTLK